MRKRFGLASFSLVAVMALLIEPLTAYKFSGDKWPSPATTMYVAMGAPWDNSFIAAMGIWSQKTVFQFTTVNQVFDPCSNPNNGPRRNGTGFSNTICGEEFGNTTLAITLGWSLNGVTSQAGVIFNSKPNWSIYDGPWLNSTSDFQRVAVHELGHVMGLDHEDSLPSIMATSVTTGDTIVAPTGDDVRGVNTLYGSAGPTDATGPILTITSHTNGQTVAAGSIILSGSATDSGRGDSGISSVRVNSIRAIGDTASGSGAANWGAAVNLIQGANTITVAARDDSAFQNVTTQTITVTCTLTPPANDGFLSAFSLPTASGTTTGQNACASPQSGEPLSEGKNSVWWRWTAPSSGAASVDTAGSNFDTFLGVYTGSSVSTLAAAGQNDDQSPSDFTSKVSFSAAVGTTYYIAVTGYDNASGNIQLNWHGPGADLTSGTSGPYHIFPQFADGRLSDGSYYRSTLMISNPSSSASASCTYRLFGLTVDGLSTFNYTTAPGGWIIAPTNGDQSFKSGYATLQCSSSVEAQLLYSYYDRSRVKISEATVFSSPSASDVQILSDSRGGSRVGLAIANDSDQARAYLVSAYNANGNLVGSKGITLAARTAAASFVDELIPLPPGHYGQVFVSSSTGMSSIIGLRFTGGAFTTIPETTRSTMAPTARTYHVFPEYADGRLSDESYYRTTLMVSNPSGSASGGCTYRVYRSGVDGSEVSTYAVSPSGWLITQSSGTQSFKSGYATLQCSTSVEAQLLYSFYSPNGVKLSEATVFSSPSSATTQILADTREGARVGLAIANDSDQSVTYTISAYNANGALVGTRVLTALPRSAQASFVDEMIALPPDYYGQIIVSAGTGAGSIIGLRFTGAAFTTIPETIR